MEQEIDPIKAIDRIYELEAIEIDNKQRIEVLELKAKRLGQVLDSKQHHIADLEKKYRSSTETNVDLMDHFQTMKREIKILQLRLREKEDDAKS